MAVETDGRSVGRRAYILHGMAFLPRSVLKVERCCEDQKRPKLSVSSKSLSIGSRMAQKRVQNSANMFETALNVFKAVSKPFRMYLVTLVAFWTLGTCSVCNVLQFKQELG
jgi:hypothetical protein